MITKDGQGAIRTALCSTASEAERMGSYLCLIPRRTEAFSRGCEREREDWCVVTPQSPFHELQADLTQAQRYRDYKKIRKLLADPQEQSAVLSASTKRSRIDSEEQLIGIETPSKRARALPNSHPSVVDPYDPPISFLLSPSQQRTTIGPTPQKDGQLLGMFDAMSNKSNSRTPTKRTPLKDRQPNVLMTPSRQQASSIKSRDKDHLRRTQSMGNLDVRETPTIQRIIHSCTPGSKTSVRRLRFDDTPAFLRRDSTQQTRSCQDKEGDGNSSQWTPFASRLRRQSSGKSLSDIVKGLRDMEEERFDEEMEVMRELEGGLPQAPKDSVIKPKVSVDASQAAELPLGPDRGEESVDEDDGKGAKVGQPLKVFKKKGQKRTTRRVNIKPSSAKWQPEPKWKGDESDDESVRDGEAHDHAAGRDGDTQRRKPEDWEGPADLSSESEKEHWKTKQAPKDMKKTKNTAVLRKRKVSATAHANFRALKIRNENSKGKGRGRFGRR